MEVDLDRVIDDFYAEVGKRIRSARSRKGVTQAELAAAVGVTRSSVTNIEAGRQRIHLHMLARIGDVLGAKFVELVPDGPLFGEGSSHRNVAAHLTRVPERMRDFVETTMAKAALARKESG
jgi:transcriptional regulator with XRE-family HTH domain